MCSKGARPAQVSRLTLFEFGIGFAGAGGLRALGSDLICLRGDSLSWHELRGSETSNIFNIGILLLGNAL